MSLKFVSEPATLRVSGVQENSDNCATAIKCCNEVEKTDVSPESGVHITVNGSPDFGEAVVVWRLKTAAVACENTRRAMKH
jgi:hypothetical protein